MAPSEYLTPHIYLPSQIDASVLLVNEEDTVTVGQDIYDFSVSVISHNMAIPETIFGQ